VKEEKSENKYACLFGGGIFEGYTCIDWKNTASNSFLTRILSVQLYLKD
jgi:hypothetical protein